MAQPIVFDYAKFRYMEPYPDGDLGPSWEVFGARYDDDTNIGELISKKVKKLREKNTYAQFDDEPAIEFWYQLGGPFYDTLPPEDVPETALMGYGDIYIFKSDGLEYRAEKLKALGDRPVEIPAGEKINLFKHTLKEVVKIHFDAIRNYRKQNETA